MKLFMCYNQKKKTFKGYQNKFNYIFLGDNFNSLQINESQTNFPLSFLIFISFFIRFAEACIYTAHTFSS